MGGVEAEAARLAEIKARYDAEAARRLRSDGVAQYHRASTWLPQMVDDPFVAPTPRDPIVETVEVAVIGAGFAGLTIAVRLLQAGVKTLRMIDRSGGYGGTWYWNRYPGAMCDVESYIYLPLLEETGHVPTRKYTFGEENREHCERIADQFDLRRRTAFQTSVIELRWDEEEKLWIVNTDCGDLIRARFVVSALGPLNSAKLPGIPGIESYQGHMFHTSRWDYAYTGGSEHGGLVGLADKRVGIIGTGSTAIQVVPHLAQSAKELYVFQRTPSSIDWRGNKPTDVAWFKSLAPGWQRQRMDNFNRATAGFEVAEDLIGDAWTQAVQGFSRKGREELARELGLAGNDPRLFELADLRKMDLLRQRIETIVEDPATAEALKPWYRWACKRPGFHDDYLPAFNRPNVTLVDTKGRGVERFTETAAVVDGQAYELDCVVLATGFETWDTHYTERSGFEIHGRGGRTMTDKWAQGYGSLFGEFSHGFPNLLLVDNAQAGPSNNFQQTVEAHAAQFTHLVGYCLANGYRSAEVTAEAEAGWVETIKAMAGKRARMFEGCTPSYYNQEGRPAADAALTGWFGGGPVAYEQALADWREQDPALTFAFA